ncbi:hypothetical protein HA402_003046 [Bradysia odoriphaga]|nr:hypothetical protein HA402_003046 [Bradysia odoriphaga]
MGLGGVLSELEEQFCYGRFWSVFHSSVREYRCKGIIRDDKDKFKCLYLLVETAVAVRQREKEQEDVQVLGN